MAHITIKAITPPSSTSTIRSVAMPMVPLLNVSVSAVSPLRTAKAALARCSQNTVHAVAALLRQRHTISNG